VPHETCPTDQLVEQMTKLRGYGARLSVMIQFFSSDDWVAVSVAIGYRVAIGWAVGCQWEDLRKNSLMTTGVDE
jgi:hypothetical protein